MGLKESVRRWLGPDPDGLSPAERAAWHAEMAWVDAPPAEKTYASVATAEAARRGPLPVDSMPVNPARGAEFSGALGGIAYARLAICALTDGIRRTMS